jgi:DnaK suppressor protein
MIRWAERNLTTMNASLLTDHSAPRDLPRYSADELREFETILRTKLASAEEDLRMARESLLREGSNGTDDTYTGSKGMEEGNPSLEREELMMLAARQDKFIKELELALARIRTGNYGVCRVTGELIPKERLRLVPHATMCINAKQQAAPRQQL